MKFKVWEYQIEIDQYTHMGDLSHIFEIGNAYREKKGDKPITMDEWLSDDQTIEFIRVTEKDLGIPPLESSSVSESLLIRHIGEKTYAYVYLMLNAAAYLDNLLKFEMTNVYFSTQNLKFNP